MSDEQDMGASADADRAATPSEPSPAVSGIAGVPSAALGFAYCNADERWSVSFYGSPPAAQIWAGHPKLTERRPIAYFEFADRTQRANAGAAIHALIDEHNSALDEAMRHVAQGIEAATAGSAQDAQRLDPKGAGPTGAAGDAQKDQPQCDT
jgi:hypothetical protein